MRLIGRRRLINIILVMLLVLGSVSGLLTPGGTGKVAAASQEWIYCANENGFCAFSGTKEVLYGVVTSEGYMGYITTNITGGVSCNNSAFVIGDPLPGVPKQCYIREWTPDNYTVNFAVNGGSAVASMQAVYDTAITAPSNPTKANYTFAGWYKTDALTAPWHFNTDKVQANITLYAKWLSTSATLSSSLGDVSTGGTANETVTHITYGTTLDALKAAIAPAAHATYQIYESDGITEATTLVTGCIIIVTAEDGVTSVSYTVSLNPPSSNARLSLLNVVQGEVVSELSTDQLTHAINVPNNVSNLSILFTKADPTESIVVTGADYSTVNNDVYTYIAPNLLIGTNAIQIKVTAQDGTTNEYEIYVYREPLHVIELSDLNHDGVLDIMDVSMTILSSPVNLRHEDVEELLSQISPQLR